ncbi:PAS domain S-box-containing protein [Verrucomicrobium sp. GAS474]|uniref:PAS domain-containing protein n=1 Tax=Verrucomicrobium sp. GAS474 TaxID=1882831 RepID=UPI000879FBCE|nr:PAS domain-containing protein [Verrucomicrobium sp. GAS474]SDT97347.1 PAS domain S-box-containing protein [Verrucomicrobium sp. GAS474]
MKASLPTPAPSSVFEKPEYARAVIENSPDCVNLLDRDGHLLAMNGPGMDNIEIDNFEPYEGKRWSDLWPEAGRPSVEKALAAALDGQPVRFQGFCPTAKGSPRWWDVIVTPVRQPDGRVEQLLSVSRDITHHRAAEEKTRQSEEQLQALTQASPDLVSIFSTDGHCEFCNERWSEFSGLSIAHGVDFSGGDLVHAEDRARMAEQWAQCLRTGSPLESEVRLRRFDGVYRWFLSRILPARNEAGDIVKWYGASSDITAQRETTQALAKMNATQSQLLEERVAQRTAQLQKMVEELELLSYSLSHDLRQPLRAMQQYSQILIEDYARKLDATGEQYLQQIIRATTRMDRLIQDVLTYAQLSRASIALDTVDVDTLTHDIIAQYPLFKEPHASVTVEGILMPVMASGSLLTQIISNLLGNAVKFIAAGIKPRVTIFTEKREALVRIHIRDNGIGIKPENLETIWKMFERLHVAKEYEGTGIGLSIVRKSSELMGGRAGVESIPGEGSTFWIDLPRAKGIST